MTSKPKRYWGWAICLMAALAVCGVGCQPSTNPTTKPNTTTAKQPDNKKPVEPKADPG